MDSNHIIDRSTSGVALPRGLPHDMPGTYMHSCAPDGTKCSTALGGKCTWVPPAAQAPGEKRGKGRELSGDRVLMRAIDPSVSANPAPLALPDEIVGTAFALLGRGAEVLAWLR